MSTENIPNDNENRKRAIFLAIKTNPEFLVSIEHFDAIINAYYKIIKKYGYSEDSRAIINEFIAISAKISDVNLYLDLLVNALKTL